MNVPPVRTIAYRRPLAPTWSMVPTTVSALWVTVAMAKHVARTWTSALLVLGVIQQRELATQTQSARTQTAPSSVSALPGTVATASNASSLLVQNAQLPVRPAVPRPPWRHLGRVQRALHQGRFRLPRWPQLLHERREPHRRVPGSVPGESMRARSGIIWPPDGLLPDAVRRDKTDEQGHLVLHALRGCGQRVVGEKCPGGDMSFGQAGSAGHAQGHRTTVMGVAVVNGECTLATEVVHTA